MTEKIDYNRKRNKAEVACSLTPLLYFIRAIILPELIKIEHRGISRNLSSPQTSHIAYLYAVLAKNLGLYTWVINRRAKITNHHYH